MGEIRRVVFVEMCGRWSWSLEIRVHLRVRVEVVEKREGMLVVTKLRSSRY
jgi:hypothetical protein